MSSIIPLSKSLSEIYNSYFFSKDMNVKASLLEKSMSANLTESGIIPLNSIQSKIRPLFGKTGIQPISIGDHPDFLNIKGTEQNVKNHIVTLFMDIENSTRFNLFYSPEEVQKIKQSFICSSLELIKTFDGHVHRIMGDAVMAFFGGKYSNPQNDLISAINCAATLQYFVDLVVIPFLVSQGYDEPFGIRIGIDYGDKENVIFSSYGYPGMCEVTATSFYVDVASKLQHQAPRNQVMIGENAINLLDFPLELLKIKKIMRNGEPIEEKFLVPNYTLPNKEKQNYKKFILDWKEYLKYSYVGVNDKEYFYHNGFHVLPISCKVFSDSNLRFLEYKYYPNSIIIPKKKHLLFEINVPPSIQLPCQITFKVENHGKEASALPNNANHQQTYTINKSTDNFVITHKESTSYSGLHFMKVTVSNRFTYYESSFGVYVQ